MTLIILLIRTNALIVFFNILCRTMLGEKAEKMGIKKVYNDFRFKDLSGKEVLFKKASTWELQNIPIDEAINLFDKLETAIKMVNPEIDFENLFQQVTNEYHASYKDDIVFS